MKYNSAAIGFQDKRSNFQILDSIDGKIHISGNIFINDIQMRFTLNEQKKGSLMRGRISIISPEDGKVLQMSEAKKNEVRKKLKAKATFPLKKNNRVEAYNCWKEFVINSIDEKRIKDRITYVAMKLYDCHKVRIREVQGNLGPGASYTSNEANTILVEDFVRKYYIGTSIKNQRTVLNTIKKVTVFFGNVPMEKVSRAMIRAYMKQYTKNAKSDLNYARKFWDFCREKSIYSGENPLEIYRDDYTAGKDTDPKKAIRKAFQLISLPFEVEKKLNEIICDNLDNGLYIGLLLIMEFNFTVKEACLVRWKNIIHNGKTNYKQIHIKKESLAGATHDYTRPLSPLAADILMVRYLELREKHSEEDIMKFPLVSQNNNPKKPLNPKELNNLCRTALIRAGIDQYKLTFIPGINEGAGVRLLRNNLRYRLENECGLADDPAAVSFLLGNSLQTDVTADHYRSFISEEGQMYLYNAIKRDTRFSMISESAGYNEIIKEARPDGRIKYEITPESPGKITSFKVKLLIKPGDRIKITAPQGVTCSIETLVYSNSKKATDINIPE